MEPADDREEIEEQRESELQFAVVGEQQRGGKVDEETAARATGSDREVVAGEPARRRAQAVEFAVAHHARDEERGDERRDHLPERRTRKGEKVNEEPAADDQQRGERSPGVPARVIETENKRHQIYA